jgi:hypothetical protein
MNSSAKAVIVSAVITAAGAVIVAFISILGSPGPVQGPDQPITLTLIVCPTIPPTSRSEPGSKDKQIWIPEDWNWVSGKFELMPGHWQRMPATPGQYVAGHWDTSQGKCTWISGRLTGD